jgi:hypothetical protein
MPECGRVSKEGLMSDNTEVYIVAYREGEEEPVGFMTLWRFWERYKPKMIVHPTRLGTAPRLEAAGLLFKTEKEVVVKTKDHEVMDLHLATE